MSWFPVNRKHKHLEDTRLAFREYVMGDLAGDLEMKMRGWVKLCKLKETPNLPARCLPNKGVYASIKIPMFFRVINAVQAVLKLATLEDGQRGRDE